VHSEAKGVRAEMAKRGGIGPSRCFG
jgi:hypothetical protein